MSESSEIADAELTAFRNIINTDVERQRMERRNAETNTENQHIDSGRQGTRIEGNAETNTENQPKTPIEKLRIFLYKIVGCCKNVDETEQNNRLGI